VRTFAHSAASVLLAIYLDLQGFGLFEIGLFLTIGSAGAVFWAMVAGLLGDLMGRRRLLTVMAFLSAITGVALITSPSLQLLAAAAFLESFSRRWRRGQDHLRPDSLVSFPPGEASGRGI
jgi:MFS family permease